MPRNLVICCDGTNNEFGEHNTNVIRLVQSLLRDSDQQRLYYDPGVGTLPEPGLMTSIGKTISKWISLAFGVGLFQNVAEAYAYLMQTWESGDRVFLFGFSRGAYTVRVLAGLLHTLGLLPSGNDNLIPYALRLYRSIRKRPESGANAKAAEAGAVQSPAAKHSDKDSAGDTSWYWRLCNAFRGTFSRPAPGHERDRRFPVHFLGVWDTVSSVGWVFDAARFPNTAYNPNIAVVRHAVALDERRWFFRQNLIKPAAGQDVRELWFPGVHADVGGGYLEKDSGLWRQPLAWMLEEARHAGLLVDEDRLHKVLNRTPPSPAPWNDEPHESLTIGWRIAEYIVKPLRRPASFFRPRVGSPRYVLRGAELHKSALLRIRERNYAPANLPASFLEKVRALEVVPEWLAVEEST